MAKKNTTEPTTAAGQLASTSADIITIAAQSAEPVTAPPVEPVAAPPAEPVAPVEPVAAPPAEPVAPVKTVTEETLIDLAPKNESQQSSSGNVDDADLLGGGNSETESQTVNTDPNGCQCHKCKVNPNKDKRGRHHKSCPCKVCNPAPSFADIRPTAAAVNYQVMAETTFDLSTGILTMVFGDEWKPRSPDERTSVVMPLKAYLETKQVQDIPPGLMLTIVAVAYAAPRFQAPSTKQKLSLAWAWTKSKFASWFKKKKV